MTEPRRTLVELEMRGDFIRRHIGPGEPQLTEMLAALGLKSLDELVDKAVPAGIRSRELPRLPEAMSEREALSYLRRMAGRNRVFTTMIGMGYYGTITPSVIVRNVLENPGWYTAYTPYQAEVSQGRLEVLLNFQQMVMDLTGMELANASLLDEGTAAAEAMAMANAIAQRSPDAIRAGKALWNQAVDLDAAQEQTDVDPTHIALSLSDAGDAGIADLVNSIWLNMGNLQIAVQAVEGR